ncbi:MAG: transglutaminase-like domain-containing protein [Oscillospiraceae bacterium]|nr:transglutaminase-like domain-containing protein [Oscillospiraceae bacterium]
MKKTLIFLSLITVVVFGMSTANNNAHAQYQNTLGRRNFLLTSYDKENYTEFTIRDNVIYAVGKYAVSAPLDVYFSGGTMTGYQKSLNAKLDGSFTATLSGVLVDGNTRIAIRLPSTEPQALDEYLLYRIEYNNGWFFGDNSLAEKGERALESALDIPPEITAVYIDYNSDVDVIRDTLNEVRDIAQTITEGITDDYQKAKALSSWVSENIYYDEDASEGVLSGANTSLVEVLKTKRTVCGGYAGLYAALLEAVGINALVLNGGVVSNNGVAGQTCSYEELPFITLAHEFNAFWYDKENRWVYDDVGWNSDNSYSGGNYIKNNRTIKYFDITPLAFSFDHRIDSAQSRKYFEVLQEQNDEVLEEPPTPQETAEERSDEVLQEQRDEISEERIHEPLHGSDFETADEEGGETFHENEDEELLIYYVIAAVLAGLVIVVAVMLWKKFLF